MKGSAVFFEVLPFFCIHNIVLMEKSRPFVKRFWDAKQTIDYVLPQG